MQRLILITAIATLLAGCAAYGPGYRAENYPRYADGRNTDPYRSQTGSIGDWSHPYYGDRYWPPVVPGQAFPPQIMDNGKK